MLDFNEELRRRLDQGLTLEISLRELRAAGASIIESIVATKIVLGCGLLEAKRLIDDTNVWKVSDVSTEIVGVPSGTNSQLQKSTCYPPFDSNRLVECKVTCVYPYAYWSWTATNGRVGGMVCFRGNCRRGPEGKLDLQVIDWCMENYFSQFPKIQILVVDTWEFNGDWADGLNFVPPSAENANLPVLYSVMPNYWERAKQLWGDAVREDLDSALAEADEYLRQLPAVG